jgi:hypothetical protein
MGRSVILKCNEGEKYQIQVYLDYYSRTLERNKCFAEFFLVR